MRRFLPILLTVLTALPSAAQYNDNRALQKNFEQASFFFEPGYLNPYGLEGFGPGVVGLITDPLLDVRLSPSLAHRDSTAYVYVDFRSTRERNTGTYYYPAYRGIAYDQAALIYYPPYQVSTYKPAEPVLSAAFLARPSPDRLPGLTAGFTYQLTTDNQDYYEVPNNLYRGLDLAQAAEQSGFPIVDVYGGSDHMRTMGHFPSVFASYRLDSRWTAGARLGFAAFDRDGEFGNFYNPVQPVGSVYPVSVNSQFDTRSQRYRHTDLSLGIHGALDARTVVGGSIGFLSGDADQFQDGASQYRYDYGGDSTNTSRYLAGSVNQADLSRSGSAPYGSAFLRRTIDENRVFTASWRGQWQSLELAGTTLTADSSYSLGRSRHADYRYHHEYGGHSFDERSGTGTGTGTDHRVSLGLEWRVAPKDRLMIGLVGTRTTQATDTREAVSSARSMMWHNDWHNGETGQTDTYSESLSEVKEVEWTLATRTASIQLPVMLWHEFNDKFELVAGFMRVMEDRRVTDETVALIDSREHILNGSSTVRRNFGERYREPTQYRSIVESGAILGLTASPSPNFDVRLLVSPRWSNEYSTRRTQWWLGFQLKP